MNFVLRAAAASLAAVALTPAVAAAQQQYTVDFGWTPEQPTVAEKVTLRAATTAPDVNWDFDADGDFDARGAVVEHQFATAGTHRVTVAASWPGAAPIVKRTTKSIILQAVATPTPEPTATATPELTPTPTSTPAPPVVTPQATPAPCVSTFTAGKLIATANGCFVNGVAKSAVNVNGMMVTPHTGTSIVFENGRTGTSVKAANARVTFMAKGTPVVAYTGKLEWKLVGDQLTGFKTTGATLGGMKLAGAPKLTLPAPGKAQLSTRFTLPANLGGGTSQPVAVKPNTSDAVAFTISNGGIHGINLTALTVRFEGGGSWSVDAQVTLPPPLGLKVKGGLAIKNGAFSQLYSTTSFGTGNPFGPLTLKRLHFAVEANPAKSQCRAAGAKAAMCGELALTVGPKLLGAPALSLDGGFGLNLFDHKPSTFKARGKVKLVGMTLKDAELEVRGDGYVGVKSKLDLGWPGIATIKGSSSIEFQGTKFNGESKDQVCLEFVDYCLGAQTLISTKGLAACLNIDIWGIAWHPGIGVKWGHGPDLYWSGCDLAPYRETFAKAAAAGDHSVRLPGNLPAAAIAVTGTSRVALIGPKGERFETPAGNRPLATKDFFVMTAQGVTQIAIRKPAAGTWKVVALEGTIASVKSANGLPRPSVKAKLRKGKLTYSVKRIPGQVVRFTQNGKQLGRAKGKRGTLRVKAKGPITALIEQNGQLRDRVTIKR